MITDLTAIPLDFTSLFAIYSNPESKLNWNLVFMLPAWLKIWWQHFGSGAELFLYAAKSRDQIIGIAPLQVKENTASFIGGVNVCDYQDFIVIPGRENDFFNIILDQLVSKGIRKLHLETVRPDSTVITHLMPMVQSRHFKFENHQVDSSSDIELPANWEEYLERLDKKQRHELRRKMRNLQEFGGNKYYTVEDKKAIPAIIAKFLQLFPESRSDKAEFMTSEMQSFFKSLTKELAETGILRFGILEVLDKPAAMVMYFDYNNNIYLYNSAYDPDYRDLSVGIISKTESIRDAIQKKKNRYDFLKGTEKYKTYLGGKEIPLDSCEIEIG